MGREFKEFALKGNVVDMAVGVVIGAAFGKIVTSFLNDVLMPPLGLLTGSVSFADHTLVLKAAADKAPAVAIRYGAFLTAVIDFAIVAAATFLLVKAMNGLRLEKAAPPPPERLCPECRMAVPTQATRCGHCAQPLAAS
ncbi:MAG: large-conductance mechanosensitive channel protein MscL [Elusimicrobia bacterium]|nr:large-conductance mechanosensitive channel protein MscL [Elusimicrobiota bacterium]